MNNKIIILSIFLILILCGCTKSNNNIAIDKSSLEMDVDQIEYLVSELEKTSDYLMFTGEDVADIYTDFDISSITDDIDDLPSEFDLRDKNVVTSVKSQDPWSSCWSFAVVAASEIDILNDMNMTVDSYKERYGEDFDLSEKHLAWFSAKESSLETDNEGFCYINPLDNVNRLLSSGGNCYVASSVLANGVGLVKELEIPYLSSDGDRDRDGDWSIPESLRYNFDYELNNVDMLPSPAFYDFNDTYKYRDAATVIMKSELLNGKGICIGYKADNENMISVDDASVKCAQYVNKKGYANHSAVIVGWDDNFKAVNWPEIQRPPGDGVWIVKNSMGDDWGDNGYFLLSYYDMSIEGVGVFDFNGLKEDYNDDQIIYSYDKTPVTIINSITFDKPVDCSNVFIINEESILDSIMVVTGKENTNVTASVYLLDDNNSVDFSNGILLGSVSNSFKFKGFHRLNFVDDMHIADGSRIAVVVTEQISVKGHDMYVLTITDGISLAGVDKYNQLHESEGSAIRRYTKNEVGQGESFVKFDDIPWIDWSDIVLYIDDVSLKDSYMTYDNFPIKVYMHNVKK